MIACGEAGGPGCITGAPNAFTWTFTIACFKKKKKKKVPLSAVISNLHCDWPCATDLCTDLCTDMLHHLTRTAPDIQPL